MTDHPTADTCTLGCLNRSGIDVRDAKTNCPRNVALRPEDMPPIEDVDTLLYWAAVYSIRLPEGCRLLAHGYDIWVALPDGSLVELNLTEGLTLEQMQASVDEDIATHRRHHPTWKGR
jgi:hypothetical protein